MLFILIIDFKGLICIYRKLNLALSGYINDIDPLVI